MLFLSVCKLSAQEDCIPQILLEEYEADVKHLALMRMEVFNAPALDSIEVDSLYQDTIWKGLSKIFHSSNPFRDDVFDRYCIHHDNWTDLDYPRISYEINVRIDTNVVWYENWLNGIETTGDAFIDSLIHEYGLEVSMPLVFLEEWFRLSTEQCLNLNALAAVLRTHPSILSAARKSYAGGSKRIRYNVVDGSQLFTFSIGWGDCPAGCLHWENWHFSVSLSANNEVLYGRSGEVNPFQGENCNITYHLPVATLALPRDTFCIDEWNVPLSGGNPAGGEFVGDGINDNLLDPSLLGVGEHTVSYVYHEGIGCYYTATQTINVIEENCITSSDEIEEDNFVHVYPIPTAETLHVAWNEETCHSSFLIELFNTSGALVLKKDSYSGSIDVAGLPKGIYLVRLSCDTLNFSKKIIIN